MDECDFIYRSSSCDLNPDCPGSCRGFKDEVHRKLLQHLCPQCGHPMHRVYDKQILEVWNPEEYAWVREEGGDPKHDMTLICHHCDYEDKPNVVTFIEGEDRIASSEEWFGLCKAHYCLALRNYLVFNAGHAANAFTLFHTEKFQAAIDTLDPDFPGFDSVDMLQATHAFAVAMGLIVPNV